MQDGPTQVVEIAVECPKCRQESMVGNRARDRKPTEVYRMRLLPESMD
jgi:hypothetical protein